MYTAEGPRCWRADFESDSSHVVRAGHPDEMGEQLATETMPLCVRPDTHVQDMSVGRFFGHDPVGIDKTVVFQHPTTHASLQAVAQYLLWSGRGERLLLDLHHL